MTARRFHVLSTILMTGASGVTLGMFSPGDLFAASEPGAWYDPSDMTTLFQDAAGTTPVTATSQPVGRILDKSGRGNHATQATSASRPTLEQDANGCYYLNFDGTDDSLSTGAVNFTSTSAMSIFAGLRKNSDAAVAILAELGVDSFANAGGFYLAAPLSADLALWSRGTVSAGSVASVALTAPATAVISAAADILNDIRSIRLNQGTTGTGSGDQGSGNFINGSIYIGRRANSTLPFNGRLYGLIVRGAATSGTLLSDAETWMNTKTRAY